MNIEPKAAHDMIKNGAILMDVREANELDQMLVPCALHNPLSRFDVNKLPRDKDVVLICRTGARSGSVTNQLKSMGFENIKNLSGGIMRWANEGLPVE